MDCKSQYLKQQDRQNGQSYENRVPPHARRKDAMNGSLPVSAIACNAGNNRCIAALATFVCLGLLWTQVMALPEQAITQPADVQGGAVTGLVMGEYTYMARGHRILTLADDGQGGLEVVHQGELFDGPVTALAGDGDHLVAGWRSAGGQGRLSWLSLAEPAQPEPVRHLSYTDADATPMVLLFAGQTLYLVDRTPQSRPLRLFSIDLADPDAPEVFESMDFCCDLAGLTLFDEQTLLVTTINSLPPGAAVRVMDISQPNVPEEIGLQTLPNVFATAETVAGDGYFAVFTTDGVRIISMEDPTLPIELATVPMESRGFRASPGVLHEDYLMLVADGELNIWSLSDPANPLQQGVQEVGIQFIQRTALDPVSASAILVDWEGAVLAVDLSDPSEPVPVVEDRLPFPVSVWQAERLPYGLIAPDSSGDLWITDEQLESATMLDPGLLDGQLERLQARPDGLVMLALTRSPPVPAEERRGIQMLDLSDPSEPGISEFLVVEGLAPFGLAIALDGELAWVAGGDTIRTFDLSDPLDPVPGPVFEGLEHEPVSGMAFDEGLLHVFGQHPPSGADDHGLWIYQTDDSGNLTLAGFYHSAADCPAETVTARNGLVTLVCGRGHRDWHFVDASDPTTPVLLGVYDADSGLSSSAWLADDELAWLGFGDGVDLVDLSDPATPRLINRYFLGGQAVSIVGGHDPVVATRADGLHRYGGGLARLELPPPVATAHTAAWYDPDRDGEGWMIEVLDDHQALAYWYTYDEQGNPAWLTGTGEMEGNRIAFELHAYSGAGFGPGFDPGAIESTPAGTAHFRFTDCDRGWFRYELDDEEPLDIGLDRLTRVLGLEDCDETGSRSDQAGQSGSWYDPLYSGQGFTVHHLDNGQALLKWFTYDSQGDPYWVIGTGEEQAGRLVFPELISGRGAVFGAEFDPDDVEFIDWGELEMELDCLTGTAEYISVLPPFGSGAFVLDRLTIPRGLDCE
jgi:hypothetical protein